MRRPIVIAVALAASLLAACGGEIEVPEGDQTAHRGAVLFNERCSGCHSLDAANAYGSKPTGQLQGGERTDQGEVAVHGVRVIARIHRRVVKAA